MADLDALRFRESLNVLKGLIDQRRSHDDQPAAATSDDIEAPEYLEETWKAKLLSVQVELQEERKKRQAAEQTSESLQAKISNELDPKVAKLERQVASLEQENDSLANKMHEEMKSNQDSLNQLQSALEEMTRERDEANHEVKRIDEELERSQNTMMEGAMRERQRYQSKILSLENVINEITESRDSLQSLLERKSETAAAGSINKEDVEAILDHFQKVIESASDAIASFENIAFDPPDGSLQLALDLRGIFEASVDEAMQLVATIRSQAEAEEVKSANKDYESVGGTAQQSEIEAIENQESGRIDTKMIDRGADHQETDNDSASISGLEDDSTDEEPSDDSERYQNRSTAIAGKPGISDDHLPPENPTEHREVLPTDEAKDCESTSLEHYDSAQEEWLEEKPKRKFGEGDERGLKKTRT